MIPLPEIALLLRGWRDSKSPLRVIFKSQALVFSAHCRVWEATEHRVVFALRENEDSRIDFLLVGCVCGFIDVPPEQADLPIGTGERVESGISCVRPDFELTVMLLREDDEVDTGKSPR